MDKVDPSIYHLHLSQLKLVYELIGIPDHIRPRDISDVSTVETDQQVTHIEAVVRQHSRTPLRYKGKPIDLTGLKITILTRDEKYPEPVMSVLDAAYLKSAELTIALPNGIFVQLVELLSEQRMPEANMICDVFFDNKESPENLHIRFRKMWLTLPPPVPTPRLTMLQIILAIVIGMIIFGWVQRTETAILISICVAAFLITVFWPPRFIPILKGWRGEKQWWREVKILHKKWDERDKRNEVEKQKRLEEEAKWVQTVKLKCELAEGYYRNDMASGVPEILEGAAAQRDKFIQTCLADASKVEDDFYKSTILHGIARLMCNTGELERGRKLIESITVDMIREMASKELLSQKAR